MDDYDYLLFEDPVMVPLSAVEYWSDESDYDDDFDDDEVEYDKNGRRFWRKKNKDKGDDRSKAIDWRKQYRKFDYAELNKNQEMLALRDKAKSCPGLSEKHSIGNAKIAFERVFERQPGWYRRHEYVRNLADCEYFCEVLLESPILPGVIGVDVEMENDSRPFKEWYSKWRTIRAHSRLAKGMFARTLQVANCCGLVVVFDLYALAWPHSWSGGIECNATSGRWPSQKVALSTSTLPHSLVQLILDPNIIRFGWALHCDWSSLYNTFGLLVPQLSYLDAQAPWRHELSGRLHHRGNGLADAASALFGIHLDKSLRGYGHFWHGQPPKGIIPRRMVQYAAIDAQTSLDVALYILVRTRWLENWDNVWLSANVDSAPMPGVRKRVCAVYGSVTAQVEKCCRMESEEGSTSADSGVGTRVGSGSSGDEVEALDDDEGDETQEEEEREETHVQEDYASKECESNKDEATSVHSETEGEELETKPEIDCVDLEEDKRCKNEASDVVKAENKDITDNIQIKVSGSKRLVEISDRAEVREATNSHLTASAQPDSEWMDLPIEARQYITKSKFQALRIFQQLSGSVVQPEIDWAFCPAFMVLRGVKHHGLKRMIFSGTDNEKGSRRNVKQMSVLYRQARRLCDSNLEWAWRQALAKSLPGTSWDRNKSLLQRCQMFQKGNLTNLVIPSRNTVSTSGQERRRCTDKVTPSQLKNVINSALRLE